MTLGKKIYVGVGGILSLPLLAFLLVQVHQHILRWRAERLMADIQQIQLYQSTWTDAQKLMHRWGAWGYYEGGCSPLSCKYVITIDSSFGYYDPHTNPPTRFIWLIKHDRYNLLERFGWRDAAFMVSFTVHNGFIWRKSSTILIGVPAKKTGEERGSEQVLSLSVMSRQQLHQLSEEYGVFIGSDIQLSQHPYYKVSGPSSCKLNCQIINVVYSTRTPYEEVKLLTTFDFSCVTKFTPCTEFQQFYPLAREWANQKDLELSCKTPAWALARDANYVLVVKVIGLKKERLEGGTRERTQVKIQTSLKKSGPWTPGAIVSLYPWSTQPLTPGKQYIVFPDDSSFGGSVPPKN